MAKRISLLLTFCLFISVAFAQITPKPRGGDENDGAEQDRVKPERQRDVKDDQENPWFFGGDFGARFGTTTFINLSPSVGYKLTPRLRPGVGVTYQYWRQKDFSGAILKQSVYGSRAFVSYQFIENLIAYGEYETLRVNFGTDIWIYNLWAGAGYRQWLTEKAAVDLMLLYNLNYEPGSIQQAYYGSPWNMKMGLIIGL